ncbi:unnamed protein product [Peniophora sp. CBMAI 1063]|nr:unnamed protein product [Peniophora sp. CBMAI 1063]
MQCFTLITPTLNKPSPLRGQPLAAADFETGNGQNVYSSSEESESEVETPASSHRELPTEPHILVDEFSTLSINAPPPNSDVPDSAPESAVTPKRGAFTQAAAADVPRTPIRSLRSVRFEAPSPTKLLGKTLGAVTGKRRAAEPQETEDGHPSPLSTPTGSGWQDIIADAVVAIARPEALRYDSLASLSHCTLAVRSTCSLPLITLRDLPYLLLIQSRTCTLCCIVTFAFY